MGIEELITVSEAASLLGTGATTVRYLIDEGRLTAYRLPANTRQKGVKLYLARTAVEAFAASDWRKRARRG